MIIKRVEIKAFAGLKDFSLDFDSGLNCIYGANEAGKSTILNFILAMFYGLGDRRGKDNFRDKVKPSSGEQIRGQIVFNHNEKNYELQRTFAERTALDETKLIDLASNRIVELKDPVQPGRELFDMEEEVFKNTLFVDAEGTKLLESRDLTNTLWSKLLDFLVNSENDVKVNEVQDNLEQSKLNLRSKNGRKGLIPELELELSELRQEKFNLDNKIATQTEEINKLSDVQEQLTMLEKAAQGFNKKIKIFKLVERQEVLRLINAPKLLLEEREAEAKLLMQKLSNFSSGNCNRNFEESVKYPTRIEFASEGFSEGTNDILANLENLGEQQESLLNSLDNYEAQLIRKQELNSKKNSGKSVSKTWFNAYRFSVLVILLAGIIFLMFRDKLESFLTIGIGLLGLALLMEIIKPKIFEENLDKLALAKKGNAEILKQCRREARLDFAAYTEVLKIFCPSWKSLEINLSSNDNSTKENSVENLSRELSEIQTLREHLKVEIKQRRIYQEQGKDLDFLGKDIARLKNEIVSSRYSESDIKNLEESIKIESAELLADGAELPEFELEKINILETKLKEINEQIRAKESAMTEIKQKLKILSIDPNTHENISLQSRNFTVSELIGAKQKYIDAAKIKYQAYELAEQKLTESLLEFRQVLLPDLGERASKYLGTISSGEHNEIRINDHLAINLESRDFEVGLAENRLSSGTVEQVYLAYRLALIDYICKAKAYTLLLDDPFIFFDEVRLRSSLSLIEKYSDLQNKQVILFTCHKHIYVELKERMKWTIQIL